MFTVGYSQYGGNFDGKIKGSKDNLLNQDGYTHDMIIITQEHHEVHEGNHYYIEGIATLESGDTLRVSLVTPNTTTWAHFTWEIGSSLILWTGFYEDAIGDSISGGSSVTPINNNRNSSNTSVMTITSGVSVNSGNFGTLISQAHWGIRTAGGTQTRGDELILKQNATYLRLFVSSSAGNRVTFKASWYEEESKE